MSYYLHYFSRKQPDLKWENPRVRHEIYELMRFWFDKGIDGFRMDSIPYISKDISYPEVDSRKYPDMFDYYSQGPHLHDYLREINEQVTSRYAVMTVGEGSGVKPPDLHRFVEPSRRELNMLYTFEIPDLRKTTKPDAPDTGIDYSLLAVKKMFAELDRAAGDGWPAIYLGNHDQPRVVSRFGSDAPEHRENAAKMLATFLLTMRGTPFWLAGDEIGMSNIRFENIDDYNDIDTRNRYLQIRKEGGDLKAFLEEQKQTARDNARTPFQWDGSERSALAENQPEPKTGQRGKRAERPRFGAELFQKGDAAPQVEPRTDNRKLPTDRRRQQASIRLRARRQLRTVPHYAQLHAESSLRHGRYRHDGCGSPAEQLQRSHQDRAVRPDRAPAFRGDRLPPAARCGSPNGNSVAGVHKKKLTPRAPAESSL